MKLNLEGIKLRTNRKIYRKLFPHMDSNHMIDVKWLYENLSIQDAVWCLGCSEYRDRCLFLCDVIELCLTEYCGTSVFNLAIRTVRRWYSGLKTDAELKEVAGALTGLCNSTQCVSTSEKYKTFTALRALMYTTYLMPDVDHSSPFNICTYAAHATDNPEKAWKQISDLFQQHFAKEQ